MRDDTLGVNRTGCLRVTFTWHDDDDVPIDATVRTFRVIETSFLEDLNPTIEIIPEFPGRVDVCFSQEQVAMLRPGRANWFRLAMDFHDTCEDISSRLWLELQ